MIKLIPPQQFKQITWKNGKGKTTELAISEDGTLKNFDWRISIASVNENGPFSDFSGYLRHLILIQGNGIELVHDRSSVHTLENILDIATFNGASQTIGKLVNGSIKDFNIMTKEDKYSVTIKTITKNTTITLKQAPISFIFGLQDEIMLTSIDKTLNTIVPQGYLTQITNSTDNILVTGKNIIIIHIKPKETLLKS